GKDVLTGRHRGLNVLRPKTRRGRQQYQVHFFGVEQLLVGVAADVTAFVRNLDLIREAFFQVVARVIEVVFEDVCDRDQLDVGAGVDAVLGGPPAAPAPPAAAADQADADHVAAAGVDGWNLGQVRGDGRPDGGRS